MSFLQIPNALFINKKYRSMSIEAKLAYGLLLRRMQLSDMNGWTNEAQEIYVIYTREQMAAELCVSYKKSVASFRELSDFGLILEKRRGRGLANHIYISKAEISEEEAAEYTENLRHVETTHQDAEIPDSEGDTIYPEEEPDIEFTEPSEVLPKQDLSDFPFKICKEIANHLQVTRSSVEGTLHRLGITEGSEPGWRCAPPPGYFKNDCNESATESFADSFRTALIFEY